MILIHCYRSIHLHSCIYKHIIYIHICTCILILGQIVIDVIMRDTPRVVEFIKDGRICLNREKFKTISDALTLDTLLPAFKYIYHLNLNIYSRRILSSFLHYSIYSFYLLVIYSYVVLSGLVNFVRWRREKKNIK